LRFGRTRSYDGPVSYRLEWNGLTFVFSGDTTPSQFFIDNAKGADLLIHECFSTVTQLIERSGYDERPHAPSGPWCPRQGDVWPQTLHGCHQRTIPLADIGGIEIPQRSSLLPPTEVC
jgi:hypothetical protein